MKNQLNTVVALQNGPRLRAKESPKAQERQEQETESPSIRKDKQKPSQTATAPLGLDLADSHHQARHTQRSKE